MTTLEKIERDIRQLSKEDLRQFRKWFAKFDADLWDEQLEMDAGLGQLDKLADEALKEYYEGKAKQI